MTLIFDYCNRRAYRVQRPLRGVLLRDVMPGGMSLAVLPIGLYFATFWAWFASETSVYRYEVGNDIGTGGPFSWVPAAIRSLGYYQSSVLQFHSQLTNSNGNYHPWESKPWTWPMSLRPMLYAYTADDTSGTCGSGPCVRAVMAIGTPALVWLAVPVLAWALWKTVVKRDWAYASLTLFYFATYLPWFLDLDRQMYYFYALTLMPFYAIMVALICRDLLGMRGYQRWLGLDRQVIGKTLVVTYTALVVLNFAWLWPILTASPIPEWMWTYEIWLPSWR
jgi:dolichyl-phosphate-mannose-protein mannosyltransferase